MDGRMNSNDDKGRFIVIDASVTPDVFLKVITAERLIQNGEAASVIEAVQRADISRSAFYKYRGKVFPYDARRKGETITFAMSMSDVPGILSNALTIIAESGANVLTISQTIPIRSLANVTMTIETAANDVSGAFERIRRLDGVAAFKILNRE
ncbi:MAG: ACT domain-containing protein [Clostridiales bacterium]|jgi:chorismate mutase|nr:ACT domain-containing protein [Clostridiales bacterium]